MKVGILGTGNVGGALGKAWASAGHNVVFGGRDPDKAAAFAAGVGEGACGGTVAEAAAFGEAVLIATPWGATEDALRNAGPLLGKILIDATNPLSAADFREPADLGGAGSAAELIQGWAPGARVVKAFNTIFAATMAVPAFDGVASSMLYCGDDAGAKAAVARLIAAVGFEPIDAGPLAEARYLEAMCLLAIRLAFKQGLGSGF